MCSLAPSSLHFKQFMAIKHLYNNWTITLTDRTAMKVYEDRSKMTKSINVIFKKMHTGVSHSIKIDILILPPCLKK